MSTATKGNTATAPKTKRLRVNHFFWVKNMEAATQMGVDMRSQCGVWESPVSANVLPDCDRVEVTDNLTPLPWPRDCKRCLRVLEARARVRNLQI